MFPEYVLHWLGAPRVAEFTNATHTGLVDIHTGNWHTATLRPTRHPHPTAPTIVPAGTILGPLHGPLAELPAFQNTQLIAPACHDTASAIAGIPTPLDATAYICSGTWSLVGTVIPAAITTPPPAPPATPTRAQPPADSSSTPTSTACGSSSNVWIPGHAEGRPWNIEDLVAAAAALQRIQAASST